MPLRFRIHLENVSATRARGATTKATAFALLACLVLAAARAEAQGFTNVSAALGTDVGARLSSDPVAGGLSVVDLDGDGRLDLVLTPLGSPVVFHQQPSGTFERRDDVLSPVTPGDFGGHLPFDMDGDGDLDVLLLGHGEDALLRNDGGLSFTDVSRTHLPDVYRWSAAAASGDFDGDGDVDVYIATYLETLEYPRHICAPNMLLLNDGAGHFADVAPQLGVDDAGCALAVLTDDYDGDGDLDVFVVNDFGMFVTPNRLFRNDGPSGAMAMTFSDRSAESGFDRRLYAMGVAVGDVDGDGQADVMASSIGRPGLLLADGAGGFVERSTERGADVLFSSDGYQATWGLAIEDFDRDGFADAILAGGQVPASNFVRNGSYQPNVALRGGPARFERDPAGWGLSPTGVGRGLAVGDVDGDGNPDVAIGHTDGTVALHLNDFSAAPPVRVRLRASETAASAEGARVTARCGAQTRTRSLVGGGSFAGASDAELRFSFPAPCAAAGQPVSLSVRWPSGYTQRANTTTGAALSLTEPDWLRLTPGRVELHPTDPSGDALPSSASVIVRRDGASPVVATPISGGGFEASVAVGAGPARLDLEIDGRPWGAHPVVEPPTRRLHTVPRRPVVGAPTLVVARGRTLSDLPASASVSVRRGADTIPLVYDGEGHHLGTLTFPAAGADALTLVVDGVDRGTLAVPVAGAFEQARSFVRYDTLYQFGAPFFFVRGVARDVNGRRVDVAVSSLALTVGGVRRAPVTASSDPGGFELGFNTSGVADGAPIQLRLDGAPLGPSPRLRRLAAASDVVAYVSPAHTTCAPAMETMRPDGQDVLHFLIFLRDELGQLLPDLGTAPQLVGELTPLAEPVVRFDSHYLQRVRAGTTAGAATMQLEWYGEPVGVSCSVSLTGALEGDVSSARSTLLARPTDLDVSAPELLSTLTWEPRGDDRRLLGSGIVDSAWTSELGAWRSDVEYVGFGRYDRRLGPGSFGGVAEVTVTRAGATSRAEVRIAGPARPDAGIGPSDAGVTLDAGSPDAGATRDAEVIDASAVDASARDGSAFDAGPPRSDVTPAREIPGGCAVGRAAPVATVRSGAAATGRGSSGSNALWLLAMVAVLARRAGR